VLNFSNIAMTAKLFHSTNIDEWMEVSAEEAAAKRQSAMSRQPKEADKAVLACEAKVKKTAAKPRR
jgi:hypothetical protein